jgi:hypothetical protein
VSGRQPRKRAEANYSGLGHFGFGPPPPHVPDALLLVGGMSTALAAIIRISIKISNTVEYLLGVCSIGC